MPNPNGVNQFDHFEREAVYGAQKRLVGLTKEAPMSGAPMATSAIEAPRRAKRAATRGPATPQQPQATPAAPPPGGIMPTPGGGPNPYGVQMASMWAEIAAEIPDPDIQRLAQRAQQQWGYASG